MKNKAQAAVDSPGLAGPSPVDAGQVHVVGVGYTGRRLLQNLNSAIGHSRSAIEDLAANVMTLDLDTAAGDLIEVTAQDAIVYTVPPARDDDGDSRLERLLARLPTPPARVIYLSTSGVYGDRGGAVVDETSALAPATGRARRRVAAEQALTAWCGRHGSAAVILRVPGIYGPGRLGTDRLAAGTTAIAEDEAGPGNRIHVADLVRCCIAALATDVPAGVYNVGDGDHRSSTWFLSEVARQAGLAPPDIVSRDEAERTFSPMRLSFLNESRRVDVRKMREVLKPPVEFLDPAAGITASLAAESNRRTG